MSRNPRQLLRYLLWQVPGWVVVALAAWLTGQALHLPEWVAPVATALFIVKDLVLYRAMRDVFRPPAAPVRVGSQGETAEPIAPIGYVRVGGELWRATTPDRRHLPAGIPVRVLATRGLTLVVQPDEEPGAPR